MEDTRGLCRAEWCPVLLTWDQDQTVQRDAGISELSIKDSVCSKSGTSHSTVCPFRTHFWKAQYVPANFPTILGIRGGDQTKALSECVIFFRRISAAFKILQGVLR